MTKSPFLDSVLLIRAGARRHSFYNLGVAQMSYSTSVSEALLNTRRQSDELFALSGLKQ